jgi:hypothetical protein
LLPLEFRAYWKLSWPKARERIRTNWPTCPLGNLMWRHWEQQRIGIKTKPWDSWVHSALPQIWLHEQNFVFLHCLSPFSS